nr:hypothetical protein [Tanacetum cinerariifolium]
DAAPRGLQQIAPQHPPNGFDAVYLIAVHAGHQQQHRARFFGPNDVHRHVNHRARGQLRNDEPREHPLTGFDD